MTFSFLSAIVIMGAGVLVYAQTAAAFMIVSPAPGEVVQGDAVRVVVQLPDGFTLVDPAVHTAHVHGEGHVHLWLDALPRHDDAVSKTLSAASEYTYTNVFSGLHTLRAELLRNDHTPYEPPFVATVDFETNGTALPSAGSSGQRAAPEQSGGFFLPRGRGNSIVVLVIILVIAAILWFLVGRNKKS